MSTGFAYFTVVLVWATTPLAVVWSTEAGAPVGSVWLRMMLALLLGLILLAARGERLRWDRQALCSYAAAVPGIFGAMTLIYVASQRLPSGLISVVFGLAPMVSGLIMLLLPGYRITLGSWHWIGCLLGVLGLGVIFSQALSPDNISPIPVLLLLVAVVLFSGTGIAVQHYSAGLHPLQQTLGAICLSLPCFTLLWIVSGEPFDIPLSARGIGAVLYLAAFGSLLGFLCYFIVLSRLPAATVALITLMTPVLALVIGMVLNGERPGVQLFTGAALIVLALGLYLLGDRRLRQQVVPNRSDC